MTSASRPTTTCGRGATRQMGRFSSIAIDQCSCISPWRMLGAFGPGTELVSVSASPHGLHRHDQTGAGGNFAGFPRMGQESLPTRDPRGLGGYRSRPPRTATHDQGPRRRSSFGGGRRVGRSETPGGRRVGAGRSLRRNGLLGEPQTSFERDGGGSGLMFGAMGRDARGQDSSAWPNRSATVEGSFGPLHVRPTDPHSSPRRSPVSAATVTSEIVEPDASQPCRMAVSNPLRR